MFEFEVAKSRRGNAEHYGWGLRIFNLACLPLALLVLLSANSGLIAAETDKHIAFIAGRPSHGYGSHEHFAGCRLLADTIERANVGVTTEVFRGWPEDAAALAKADAIVIYSDGGGGHPAIPHREQLAELMKAGKGFVCLHYAVEVPKGAVGDQFLDWLGGYFETDWSVNPHWVAEVTSLPELPVTRGVKPFQANDEWYFHMRFRPNMEGVKSIIQAIPPEDTMRRPDGPHSGNPVVRKEVAQRLPQTLAWTFERPDGGRSFGYTGGHFHWNWGRPDLVKLVGNAICWTAKVEIPENGINVEGRSIRQLQENQDFETPNNFDSIQVAREFKLSKVSIPRPRSKKLANNTNAPRPRKLFASPLVTAQTPGHRVEIEASVRGVKDLFLVVTDGGNGFACDWADWVDPRLIGPKGELSLLDLSWKSVSTQWGEVRKNLNAGGQPLSIGGVPVERGIGTHATSLIHFEIPAGYEKFVASGALDTGGTSQSGGNASSVEFLVYADAAPTRVGGPGGSDDTARDPENAIAGLEHPEDLEITLAASEPLLYSLTNLDIDDRGRIWVIDVVNYRGNNGRRPEGDRILILEDTDQDGVMDESKVFYQGRDIDSAMGLCVLGNEVIVSVAPNIWKFIDHDGDDIPDEKIAMFTQTGVPQHDHSNHSFLFGPDGKLYWNVGNTGQVVKDAAGQVVVDIHGRPIVDNGKPFYGGMPFRCDLDGSNMEVLAHNFRNNWETTVDSFGTLWQSDNDDDGNRGVRINFVMEHGNYGYRSQTDGSGWQAPRIGMEEEIPLRHWHLNDPGVVPNLLQTGAGSPTGITVYEGRLLPERFWDHVIHCDAGPNVVRAYITEEKGAGYAAEIHPLVTGTTDKWFRPADVCVAPDGSLFVTDWYDPGVGGHRQEDIDRGRLFRIAPPGTKYEVPRFDYSTAAGAADALRNPNYAVRFKAWMALHRMGNEAEPALLKLWEDANPRVRARALWLLGKIPAREQHYIALGLKDANPDIRITALRLARQTTSASLEIAVAAVTEDPSPAVLREAAVALRFLDSPHRPALWAKLASRYEGNDRWLLEALGIGSDGDPSGCFAAWSETVGPGWDSPAGHDLIWRVRAPAAAQRMAELIARQNLSIEATDRYFRSLEFHPQDTSQPALEQLISAVAKMPPSEKNDLVLIRSIERNAKDDWRASAEVQAAIQRHLSRKEGTPEFLALVKRFRPSGVEAKLLEIALANPDNSVGVDAMGLALGAPAGKQLIQQTLGDLQQAARVASILGLLGSKESVALAAPVLKNERLSYEDRTSVLRSLCANNLGIETVLGLVQSNQFPADLRLAAGGLLARNQNDAIRQKAAQWLPLPTQVDQKPLPPLDQLAAMRGDVGRGREVFRGKGTCANCHIVRDEGKQVGPDLSEIGDKLSREALYVSILDPSAGISHNYENYICLLEDGQVISGILVSETDDAVVLRTSEAIDRRINRAVIETLKKSDKSIMPENLHHAFDQQALIDLVEYLTTLRKSTP